MTPPRPTPGHIRQHSSNVCLEHWACEAYGRVCPNYASNAGRSARRVLEKMARDSQIVQQRIVGMGDDAHAAIETTEFAPADVLIGRILGRGGFSEVHEARLLRDTPALHSSEGTGSRGDEDIDDGSDSSAKDEILVDEDSESDDQGAHKCVVVKYLRRSVMVDRKKFARGAADLVIEASLLSALKHPNIIRLLGVTEGPVEDNFANGKDHGFFLVLDRLYDTLDHKLSEWKESQAKYSGFMFRATHDPRGRIRRAALLERLQIARSLADAVRYLHEHNVAFRDLVSFLCLKVYRIIFSWGGPRSYRMHTISFYFHLLHLQKPENIGFTKDGVLKLFDFGLAKELKPHRRLADGTYRLTGNTGSRRYMAPEVASVRPYNLSVDAYSFGILLWELSALEKPFDGFTETNHRTFVVEGGGRPEICSFGIHSYWPQVLQDLINKCWHQDLFLRPSFAYIEDDLDKCLREASDNDSVSNLPAKSITKARRTSRSTKKRVGSLVKSTSDKLTNHSDGGLNRSLGRSGRSVGSRLHVHPAA